MKNKSKYLALLLRHRPDIIGLKLDEYGWAKIDDIVRLTLDNSELLIKLAIRDIKTIVETDDKQRYAISDDGLRIRANQGHSIDIKFDFEKTKPPDILYHGTIRKFLPGIREIGLTKQCRHHVHLSEDFTTAKKVGNRRCKPRGNGKTINTSVVLVIDSKQMYNDGIDFFVSENGVWLVDNVPIKYIKNI